MENIILIGGGVVIVYLIFKLFFNPYKRVLHSYQKEIEDVLTNENNKVKGRFDEN